MMCNNPDLDLININAYTCTKFGKILSIRSQVIERKRNYYRRNDGITDGQPDAFTFRYLLGTYSARQSSIESVSIDRLFAYCKGSNFNIQIWALFG